MKRNNQITLYFSFLLVMLFLSISSLSFGQNVAENQANENEIILALDIDAYVADLADTPRRKKGKADSKEKTIELPMASGAERDFHIVENNLMAPEFAAEYPDFKTYSIQAVDDPSVSGSLTLTPYGLQATILSNEGMVYIHPVDLLNPVQHRVSLNKGSEHLDCGVTETVSEFIQNGGFRANGLSHGATLHTYTMAIVTTGEFHDENGGTVPSATAVVTNSVNSIQAIYERDLAVNFTLLTPFIYTNPATDPFVNSTNRTQQAAEAVEANFPGGAGGAYDVGHVFHDSSPSGTLGSGGIAGLGVVCSNFASGTGFRKAAGWSSSFDNTSAGWIDLASHEFGHMFNMPHTFNGDGNSNCNNNIASTNSYEIASGNSIMSYNGICGPGQNIPNGGTADHYFHIISLEQGVALINGTGCATASATGNTPPVVNANSCGGAYSIPVSTPFRLVGTGSDADGDQVYYSWEQYDEDGAGTPTQGFIGAQAAGSTIAPLFRSYPPTTDPVRYFPNRELIAANNYASDFEPLPTVARTLNFRLTGRDWKMGGGGIHCSPLAVTVSAAGPLSVTAPNGGQNLTAGNNTTVTWAVNGTNALSTNVNIKMSVDGGTTYPYILATAVPNDGSQSVTIPSGAPNTTEARIMVESADNTCVVFFDISNNDFTVNSNCNTVPHYICDASPVTAASGSGALNLNSPDIIYGKPAMSFSMNPTGSNAMGINFNPQAPGPGTCGAANFGYSFDSQSFVVETTGDYTFSLTAGGFQIMSVYTAPFSSASVCTNYIGSNAYDQDGNPGGFVSSAGSVTLPLTACTTYEVVYWVSGGAATTINVSGPGTVYTNDGGNLPANYTQTYVAVNTATGNIAAVSPTANFTSLTAGTYQVYGANYYSSTAPPTPGNPASWVGSSISTILSGGSCVLFSGNSKRVTVTGGGGGTPSLSISGSPVIAEGNAGTTPFTYPVLRTGSTAAASSVNWAVTGSVTNPANAADFVGSVLPSGTLTFPAGSTAAQTITVNVNGDTDVEPNEGFVVTLSAPTNATIGTATAVGTIQNDDAAAGYCAAGGGNPGGEKISRVQFNTIDNPSTATTDYEDFTAVSTTVDLGSTHSFTGTIANPFTADEIIVWIDFNQDFDFEDPGEEVFNSPTGTGPHTGNITIPATAMTGNTRMRVRLHDTANGPETTPCGNSTWGQVEDYTINIQTTAPPSLAIAATSANKAEGNAGNTAFTFTATRTGNTANASSANWAVTGSGGSPANAADFGGALPSGTVTFPAGSAATQTITVNVNGDTDVEMDEGFTVTLSAPTNATISTASATGTIQNDDMAAIPSLAIAATSADKAEGNAGNTAFTFTATRTGSTTNASSANWAVTGSGGDPANAADFGGALPNGTVTFPAGSAATQTITVNVNGDTDVEMDEGFTVTLSAPTNATITTATANGTIQNDDAAGGCNAAVYCTPNQTNGTCSSPDEFISNVTFNTINNNSTCAQSLPGGYTDYTNIGTTVSTGGSYTLNVTNGGPFTTDQCKVWFDWNGNGDFTDTGEEFVLTGSGINSAENWTVNVTVPATATLGSTRMRVRIKWNGAPTPCGSQSYSEAEDYCITIGNNNNCPLTRDVAGNVTTGTYQAEQTLTSDGTVGNGAMVQLKAGTSVTLENNFEVILGGELDATIENCAAQNGGNGGEEE